MKVYIVVYQKKHFGAFSTIEKARKQKLAVMEKVAEPREVKVYSVECGKAILHLFMLDV